MRNRLSLIFIVLISCISIQLTAQKQVNSPYGRFNLGILEPAGSFRGLGMGGTAVAMRDNNSVYFLNPASYSRIDTLSFIFDFGVDYSINFISDDKSKYTSDDMNFDHLLLGFPVTSGFGVAAGIVPVSNGYYNIARDVKEGDPEYDPIAGEYSIYHSGTGGLTSCFIGAGIKIFKGLSAGANLSILFGQIDRKTQYTFDDYLKVFHNNTSEKLQISGINFNYGLQYSASLKNSLFINAGVAYTPGRYYNSNYEKLTNLFSGYTTEDTISYIKSNAKAFLPGTLTAGISFGKLNKFVGEIDYSTASWSEGIIQGAEGYLADRKAWNIGFEYIPDKFSNYSLIRRIEYRLGCRFERNYLIINGEQVKETGISAGLGFPMRRSLSKTNFFIDLTRRAGPPEKNMHSELYLTMGVSLNFYDFWFIKRRYE